MAASYLGGPNLFFGSVRIYKGWDSQWRNDNFLSGVEVKLAGARDWSARTGESGKFEVQGLPAGEYRFTVSKSGLSAELPAGGSSRVGEAPDKIVMPEHGCVETSLIMRPDTKISGTVRSVDGRPIAGIEVAAYLYDDDNHPRRARSATTGDDGRYVIQRLLAGRYAVGFSSESGSDEAYPSSFHPAAPTLEEATPVFISDRQSADWIDIIVLPKRKAIPIQVRVLWPDKRPVAMATILAEHSADGTIYADAAAATDSRVTDVNGFTTIRLYEGTEYTLSAIWQKLERKAGDTVGRTVAFHHANRIRLLAVPHATVTLTISERPDPIH